MTTFIQISDRLRAAADTESNTPITVGATTVRGGSWPTRGVATAEDALER